MKTVKIKFTDAHGVTHADAVFELSYGCKNISKIETVGQTSGDQQAISVNYQFKYWHSQAAKDAGLQPTSFMDKNGHQTFGAFPASESEVVALEDYCIAHLVDVTLLSVDPNATVVV